MKKPTEWDYTNPILLLNQHVLEAKKSLRVLDKEELPQAAKILGVGNWATLRRGSLLRACLAVKSIAFKKDWEDHYGWPVDDGRDSAKLMHHIAKLKRANQSSDHSEVEDKPEEENEAATEPESISWQKAKKLLGEEKYLQAKESGEGVAEDGQKLSYVDKKWYLYS